MRRRPQSWPPTTLEIYINDRANESGFENWYDSINSPIAALDNVHTDSAPEPASWTLMLGGFGRVGSAMRRHRARVAFG